MQANEQDISETTPETNGIRVIIVMNRKGGSGKSTLVKGLASAAASRGETVTIFDTDKSQSTYQWMLNGKERGHWNPLVAVIPTLNVLEVEETIDQIYEFPDQEHLILIDTFGGGAEGLDELSLNAHLIVVPSKLSRSDILEAYETLEWHANLPSRVQDPSRVPSICVIPSAVPHRKSEVEDAALDEIFAEMPAVPVPVMSRAAYLRLDLEGLLGEIRDNQKSGALAYHVTTALNEMTKVLSKLDGVIKGEEL